MQAAEVGNDETNRKSLSTLRKAWISALYDERANCLSVSKRTSVRN